jgi:DNA (cytosine-5)-methyltransferase 1
VTAPANNLVLSLFPGVGLLDRGFEDAGFCVVRGPDKIWGGDIRKFSPARHIFGGVIGGPPCQNFSRANRKKDFAAGMLLVNEFIRVVCDAAPEWFLMENVPGSPTVTGPFLAAGFHVQHFYLDASHVGSEQRRSRKFHFGFKSGRELVFKRDAAACDGAASQPTCLASKSGGRSWKDFVRLQGLPDDFDLPFTLENKFRAVGNGVPYPLALALAQAIAARGRNVTPHRVCECGCGEFVTGRAKLSNVACRKRMQRLRDALPVTVQAPRQFNLTLQSEILSPV